ncbi:hypothetical protein AC579_4232 [Pseudocercospora musae]|uniref:Uncharacterized protein n=1 Tax=Pseudocercospora musae TaxID=113226 RepID=A0A139ID96_9PEZI|nr:hypothetical protein AC579_4232 [Pseudocercospora musae]
MDAESADRDNTPSALLGSLERGFSVTGALSRDTCGWIFSSCSPLLRALGEEYKSGYAVATVSHLTARDTRTPTRQHECDRSAQLQASPNFLHDHISLDMRHRVIAKVERTHAVHCTHHSRQYLQASNLGTFQVLSEDLNIGIAPSHAPDDPS